MNNRLTNDGNNNDGFICGVVEGFYGRPWTFEQRKDLFMRLREMKLNSFMYAPKDDSKHRAKWRQLYSEPEARELRNLIIDAKANGIDFYYSLAPGLDIIYSDSCEVDLLLRKYDQLCELGCESFAILFDDIEPTINDKDRGVFKNYASAQISVTNVIFEHLKRPKFLFCPTEYCESRAVPNVINSDYLNTLGTGLMGGIDIMWSGSRVISRVITVESIETLTKVIKRPPVIWENLHANDYDKKRIFLGPYSGRSTKIIPKLRGVLTNPNCEYEANYIAIHTLSQWSKCTEDINLHNRCHTEQRLARGNMTSFDQISDNIYDPFRALAIAIRDWLPHVHKDRSLPIGVNLTTQLKHRSDDSGSEQLVNEVGTDAIDVEESNVEMVPDETRSSATSMSTNRSEMDASSSPAQMNLAETNSCDSCDMRDAPESGNKESEPPQIGAIPIDCVMCSESKTQKPSVLGRSSVGAGELVNFDNLSILVDLFFLPFEHGPCGYALLRDFKWLRDNSDIIVSDNLLNQQGKDTRMNEGSFPGTINQTIAMWSSRADKLNDLCTCVSRLVNTLIVSLKIHLSDLSLATDLLTSATI